MANYDFSINDDDSVLRHVGGKTANSLKHILQIN